MSEWFPELGERSAVGRREGGRGSWLSTAVPVHGVARFGIEPGDPSREIRESVEHVAGYQQVIGTGGLEWIIVPVGGTKNGGNRTAPVAALT